MDWTALGTWAAVLVALGIALKDTFARWRARTARHLLVAATILPEVAQTQGALKTTITNAREALSDPLSEPNELRNIVLEFVDITTNYGLQDLSKYLDADDTLPEHILIPLAKAITLLRMLGHNGSIRAEKNEGAPLGTLRTELTEWCSEAQAAVASLDWVILGIERRLKSHRWRHPESLGW